MTQASTSSSPATGLLNGLSLIGFQEAAAQGKPTSAVNPATGATLEPPFYPASSADVDRAATLSEKAFRVLSRTTTAARAAFLRKIALLLEGQAAAIVERAGLETGLPAARLNGELGRTTGQLKLFAGLLESGWWLDARIDHADPQRAPVPKPDVRSMLRGLGPVVVFSASNFPLAFSVAGGDTASAFAAGCPVIVKTHQGHPGTSEIVGRIILQAVRECGLPEGTFSMVHGSGRDVGVALVKHPKIKAVGFTGSRGGGRALMDAAAARPEPIPVYAEMGSVNPVFVLPQALNERTEAMATGLHGSVTLGVGQFCTNPGLVFLPECAAAETFLSKLATLMQSTPAGPMLTPGICGEYRNGVERFSGRTGVERWARVETGAGQAGPALGGAALFVTTGEHFLKDHTLMDELFGPATLVVKWKDRSELLRLAERLEGQLTGTFQATEAELLQYSDLLAVVEDRVGRILFNGFPTGVEVCHAMHHGGPYPASSEGRTTSVGSRAIERFCRPLCYQNFPASLLPVELRDGSATPQLVDGKR